MSLWLLISFLVIGFGMTWGVLLPFDWLNAIHLPNWLGLFVALLLVSWCMGE